MDVQKLFYLGIDKVSKPTFVQFRVNVDQIVF